MLTNIASRSKPSKVVAISAVFLLLFAAAGMVCHAATSKTTLNVVVRNTYEDLPDPVLQRFSQLNPDVRFELIRGSSSEMDTKLTTALAAGLPVDIVISMSFRGWVSYAAQGLFRDLSPYIKADRQELQSKGVPAFILDGLKINGITPYIPYSIWSSLVTIYNATYFDEAGLVRPAARWDDVHWTWSEMIQSARKLVRTNPNGAIYRPGFRFDLNDIVQQGASIAWGSDLFPPEAYQTGRISKVTFDTPINRKALGSLVDLSVTHRVTNHALPQSGRRTINNGLAAMALIPGGSIDPATYSKEFTWGMAPYPKPDAIGNRVAMPSWTRSVAICDRSANPDVAWKFVKFLLTEAYEMGEFESEGRTNSWNLSRGVNPNTWRTYVSTISRSLELAHSQQEMLSFLVQGVGQYTRLAVSGLLVGGGETIHGAQTPLGMYMKQASEGKMSLEEALERAEHDAHNVLADIYKNL